MKRTASNALASPMYSPDQPHCSKTNVQTRNVVEKEQKILPKRPRTAPEPEDAFLSDDGALRWRCYNIQMKKKIS